MGDGGGCFWEIIVKTMKEVVAGVWQFRLLWPNAFNAYYVEGEGEGVVVDAFSTR